jgi:hypothetical protein
VIDQLTVRDHYGEDDLRARVPEMGAGVDAIDGVVR